jgi:hypothetical protein
MIGILRITSVAVAILAVLVLASVLGPVSFLDRDQSAEIRAAKILSSPGAVERFREQGEDETPGDQDTTPPLVRQAETLARIMNPPVEDAPPVSSSPRTFTPKRVTPNTEPSAMFDLVGTSYCASHPEESFAYVRLADKTYQWVQLGSVVGHLTVTEIKDGSIVCSDGRGQRPMMAEPAPDTASLLEAGASTGTPTASGPSRPPLPAALSRPEALRAAITTVPPPASRLSEGDRKDMSQLVRRLKEELQRHPASDTTDANEGPADKTAAMSRLISEFKSSRVSPEEAKRLEELGKELNGTTAPSTEESTTGRRREFMRRLGVLRATRK